MRLFYVIALSMVFNSAVAAQNSSVGIQLPSPGTTYGQDSIRAGDLDCKNSIGGSTNLEFGVTGIIDNYQSPFGGGYNPNNMQSRDVGVYARIMIPLDKPKERINCNSLYQIELRIKRLEVLRLQEELEALRRLNASGPTASGFESLNTNNNTRQPTLQSQPIESTNNGNE